MPRGEHGRKPPGSLTSLATSSFRCRPYLATTGRRTSVTGLVGLALSPTDRLIGTRSSLVGGGGTRTYLPQIYTQMFLLKDGMTWHPQATRGTSGLSSSCQAGAEEHPQHEKEAGRGVSEVFSGLSSGQRGGPSWRMASTVLSRLPTPGDTCEAGQTVTGCGLLGTRCGHRHPHPPAPPHKAGACLPFPAAQAGLAGTPPEMDVWPGRPRGTAAALFVPKQSPLFQPQVPRLQDATVLVQHQRLCNAWKEQRPESERGRAKAPGMRPCVPRGRSEKAAPPTS